LHTMDDYLDHFLDFVYLGMLHDLEIERE
jgi:hypothetical protein